jgi:hypothetical protein
VSAVSAVAKWKKKRDTVDTARGNSNNSNNISSSNNNSNSNSNIGSGSNVKARDSSRARPESTKKRSVPGMIKRPHELGGEENATANLFADPHGSTVHLQADRGNSWMSRWSKHRLPLQADDWTMHCAILTYLSDIGQVGTVTLPLKSTIDGSSLSFYDWRPGTPPKTMR